MEVDFLLIGQGLAGTVLSYRLLKEGKSVLVIDLPEGNKSSRVAAGLYNPITGRRLVKTWNADLLFPEIEPLYSSLEEELGTVLLHEKPIYIPFLSVEEQNEWMGKSGDVEFEPYLERIQIQGLYSEVNDPYGGILLKMTGYLDINTLLDHYSTYLKNKAALIEGVFEEKQLQLDPECIRYGNIKAKAIVYCNGLGAMESKFFETLPFVPVKGEILDIQQDFKPQEIINRGVFRVVLPDGSIRLGSTYSWSDTDYGPTEGAKIELFEKSDKLILVEGKRVIHHKTGIRPTTRDRKPILGKHPEYESVYIFNGFGPKGVSLVPYYSKMMVELLIHGNRPEKEVDISRFFNYI
ncbi:FAD-binding oxidoreductase [Rhodonellum sp.]|uniref:NAD(P)/FAD-dependent oxidoreductase n=1 Tax=Rhodonellum sp. TaxID=2231180 RepID=UPI00271B5B71|nr:FAD-dependent oxidoreductase [Rhodonellum sp.]MDO9550943.1 FAD-dependent oxidoreductase [Rhodonellum sp.]